jgi:hypothetical protein
MSLRGARIGLDSQYIMYVIVPFCEEYFNVQLINW